MSVQTQEKTASPATKKLAGKVALVTGGSRGIGAAIALRLAADGATVALTYAQNKTAADAVVAKITELGTKGVAFEANVSSPDATAKLIDSVVKSVGKIDILVNNAGVFD